LRKQRERERKSDFIYIYSLQQRTYTFNVSFGLVFILPLSLSAFRFHPHVHIHTWILIFWTSNIYTCTHVNSSKHKYTLGEALQRNTNSEKKVNKNARETSSSFCLFILPWLTTFLFLINITFECRDLYIMGVGRTIYMCAVIYILLFQVYPCLCIVYSWGDVNFKVTLTYSKGFLGEISHAAVVTGASYSQSFVFKMQNHLWYAFFYDIFRRQQWQRRIFQDEWRIISSHKLFSCPNLPAIVPFMYAIATCWFTYSWRIDDLNSMSHLLVHVTIKKEESAKN